MRSAPSGATRLFAVYEISTGGEIVAFRIVKTREQGTEEFLDSLRSHYELGCSPRGPENRAAAQHMGLSMYLTQEMAMETARRYPKIGRFIARLRLGPGHGFNLAPTHQPGHLTVWGRPLQLREVVADIVPIGG